LPYKLIVALTARKTTTRTHEGSKLIGVHIGAYQPWYSVLFSNTYSNQSISLPNPSTKLVLDCPSLWHFCYYFVTSIIIKI